MAAYKKDQYQKNKIDNARGDIKEEGSILQEQIGSYEREARELERMEAELLRKLQETQKSEREAFSKLESAMVEASQPKRNRLNETSRISMNGGGIDGGPSVISQRSTTYLFDKRTGLPIKPSGSAPQVGKQR